MSLPQPIIDFLTGDFQFSSELQALGMAVQGAMAVRTGANKDRKMHWFHAFALTTILAFGGGWLGFALMGKPTSMVTGGDVNVAACAIAFVVVNYIPGDIGFKLLNLLPFKILITVFAQLFRSSGMIRFINTAFAEIKPTPYYPIPVLGPIVYGTMLGNMGGLLVKGIDGYLKNGIPWPFQNGLFIGTFFHLFAHDQEGPLGTTLRGVFKVFGNGALMFGLDDTTFAHVVTAGFMQVAGVFMLPQFFGPSYNPITDPVIGLGRVVSGPFQVANPFPANKVSPSTNKSDKIMEDGSSPEVAKKKRNKRKNKTS